ncbi:hypothetical protein BTE77_06805 [Ensifer adhaerens]|nr:hypothetical protein BTE77_06805 [Ensifer adhaerens]
MIGDVLKVYHFTAALRRKKHFMYKQVVAYDTFRSGVPFLKISHLDMSAETYTVICDGSHLPDYEIVQSANIPIESRPRHSPTAAP